MTRKRAAGSDSPGTERPRHESGVTRRFTGAVILVAEVVTVRGNIFCVQAGRCSFDFGDTSYCGNVVAGPPGTRCRHHGGSGSIGRAIDEELLDYALGIGIDADDPLDGGPLTDWRVRTEQACLSLMERNGDTVNALTAFRGDLPLTTVFCHWEDEEHRGRVLAAFRDLVAALGADGVGAAFDTETPLRPSPGRAEGEEWRDALLYVFALDGCAPEAEFVLYAQSEPTSEPEMGVVPAEVDGALASDLGLPLTAGRRPACWDDVRAALERLEQLGGHCVNEDIEVAARVEAGI